MNPDMFGKKKKCESNKHLTSANTIKRHQDHQTSSNTIKHHQTSSKIKPKGFHSNSA